MRNSYDFENLQERFLFLTFLIAAFAVVIPGNADEELPFDPAKINRLSVDLIPRSISIRQGTDVWLGYDLEKAVVFKVWQAPPGKPGLILKGFKAQSSGTAWFEEKGGEGWLMKAEGKEVPLAVRYLGCTQNKGFFELRWKLSHSNGSITLSERIPMSPPTGTARAYRELRAESLPAGVSLVLPPAYRKSWVLRCPQGKSLTSLSGSAWHQLSLP